MVNDVYDQDKIISKLRKKSNKLTQQLWNLTRKKTIIREDLVTFEREKRLKLATASFVRAINPKNYITNKIQ